MSLQRLSVPALRSWRAQAGHLGGITQVSPGNGPGPLTMAPSLLSSYGAFLVTDPKALRGVRKEEIFGNFKIRHI